MLSESLTVILVVIGMITGISALVLRYSEDKHPDPNSISASKGLGHMLVGFLAGLGTVMSGFVGLFFTGFTIPVLILGVLGVCGRFVNFKDKLVPFYGLKLVLAIVSMGVCILLLINLISSIQGVANV